MDLILCDTISVVANLFAQAGFTHTLARRRLSFIPLPLPFIVGVGHRLLRGRNRLLPSALFSGLLLLVVVAVVVTRRLFTVRASRCWEAIDMDPYYDMYARGSPSGHYPQPSVPPGNTNAPPWEFLEVTSQLTSFFRNSPDWCNRCEWDPSRWKVTPPAELTFTMLITQRLRLMGLDREIPSE